MYDQSLFYADCYQMMTLNTILELLLFQNYVLQKNKHTSEKKYRSP